MVGGMARHTAHTAPTAPAPPLHPRFADLSAAVELGVEADEVGLRSHVERQLWVALQQEFEAFVAKMGPVWIADG